MNRENENENAWKLTLKSNSIFKFNRDFHTGFTAFFSYRPRACRENTPVFYFITIMNTIVRGVFKINSFDKISTLV